ncbi:MAG TPA: DMT family transporter [Thermohalobaculum sp.]|nr:DMT family transporter [Thermohalobaculum sp.]
MPITPPSIPSPLIAGPDLRPRRSDAVAGVLWMMLSCALLSGVAAMGRYAVLSGVPTYQVVFLRLLFAAIALSPVLVWRGPSMLQTSHLRLYAVRVVLGLIGMTTWFLALALLPVGEVTAIGFLTPLFSTMGAALLLGEIVRWRRWTATLIGFAGALIILRPGLGEVGPGTWLALIAALAMAATTLVIKQLSSRDDPDKIVLISVLLQTPIALIPALFVWKWLDPHLWAVCAAMGGLGMLGHITLARAFAAADASVVMSVDFARLPFAVLFGFALFGELIDGWTWVGAGVIFAASLYNARREGKLRRATPAEEPYSTGNVTLDR